MPTLELQFSQIKQFEFSWESVPGADYYQLLESADAGDDFVQIGGAIMGESIALTMPLHFRVNASYKLQACNTDGCWDSDVVDVVGTLAEAVGYFKASNTDEYDDFGWRVALSADGNTLAVGAWMEDSSATGIDGDDADNSAEDAGGVYVFVRDGVDWSQQAYVKASNTDPADHFGMSVTLSGDGNTLAVGAHDERSNATGINGDQNDNSSAAHAGAAYVFVRDGAVWSQQAYLKASNTAAWATDAFGAKLVLSDDGDTLAVGAMYEDSNATGIDGSQNDDVDGAYSGAVFVFVRNGVDWSQQAYVKSSNNEGSDRFGESLAISGDGSTLAVSATYEDSGATGIDGDQADNSASHAGAVYVFVRDGGVWSQQAYVKASNTEADDYFGLDMTMSHDGDTLAVSSWDASAATGIDGDAADNSAANAGAVHVFVRDGVAWSQQAYVKASNTDPGDRFGRSVALSGDGTTLAVGAHRDGSSAIGIGGDQLDNSIAVSGAVYVFVRDGAVWSQKAYVKASNTGPHIAQYFGYSVALSGDGTTLAVGAIGERSNATGVGGDQTDKSTSHAGAVYLY